MGRPYFLYPNDVVVWDSLSGTDDTNFDAALAVLDQLRTAPVRPRTSLVRRRKRVDERLLRFDSLEEVARVMPDLVRDEIAQAQSYAKGPPYVRVRIVAVCRGGLFKRRWFELLIAYSSPDPEVGGSIYYSIFKSWKEAGLFLVDPGEEDADDDELH